MANGKGNPPPPTQVINIIPDGNTRCRVNPPTVDLVKGQEVRFNTGLEDVLVIMPDESIFGAPSEFPVPKGAPVVKVVQITSREYPPIDPAEYAVSCKKLRKLCIGHSHPRMIIR